MSVLKVAAAEFATPIQVSLLVFSMVPTAIAYGPGTHVSHINLYLAALALLALNGAITIKLCQERHQSARVSSMAVLLLSALNLQLLALHGYPH